ncbi:MAG TPA: carboxyl transferase domain-containing protein, partial [Ilumatobacteraceae bacterium]|nr:carboxyl transferase domain-containing protein [Ilumatobacteraceae bacterium]
MSSTGLAAPLALRSRVPGAARVSIRALGERTVVFLDVDASHRRGALSSEASSMIAAAAIAAREQGLPLVAVMGSAGADIAEGFSALHGWGLAAKALTDCSGVVPTIIVVNGPAVSGPALLLGIADLVVMTESAYAFVSGPTMVAEFTGVDIDNEELGGAASHARYSGAASLVAPDVDAALAMVEQLLSYLPDTVDQEPLLVPTDDPVERETPEAGTLIPSASTGSYDVRHVIRALADDGDLLEVRARWAANVVTAFATFGGRPVGIVANQPISLAGTLDIPASQKAARFVAFCDAFNLPIITMVDTPGFYPGKDLEWRGMIRHGAQLVFAYGRATVPRICLVLRKSYGGAYIVMDSKKMGNDLCLAWPWAELAVMGAGQAAAILQRRATPDERAAFEADYTERLLNPYVAAERGLIDGVVEPADTRREICNALAALADKRERLQ